MTDYNVTVGKELLPELLSSQDGLAKLVEGVLNQILGAQVNEILGADKHQCIKKETYLSMKEKEQIALGYYIVFLSILLPIYAIISSLMSSFLLNNMRETSFYTALIMIIFSMPLFFMLKRIKITKREIGLNFENWKANTLQSILISILFSGIAFLFEIFLINHFQIFSHISIFRSYETISFISIIPALIIYIAFDSLQTFIVNGAIQAPLLENLHFKNKQSISILVATVLFSYFHITLGFSYVAFVILPTLMWSWMFAKYRSILPVYVSHVIIGTWCLFSLSYLEIIIELQKYLLS